MPVQSTNLLVISLRYSQKAGLMAAEKQARVTLDRESGVPLHEQISAAILQQLTAGDLQPGDRLESEVDIAERLGVSRPTVRQALLSLVDRGLLMRVRGQGTRVTARRVQRQLAPSSLYDDLRAAGQDPQTEVLTYELTSPPAEIAAALGLDSQAQTIHFRRLRSTGTEPLALMENHVPLEWAPSLQELRTGGLVESLRAKGLTITSAHQRFTAINATADTARLLNEPVGTALLVMTRVAFDQSGRAVEYGRHIYRGSRYSLDYDVSI